MTDCDSLELSFERAAANVASIAGGSQLSNDALLKLYGLYKQATEGPCTYFRPSFFDRKARAKWSAFALAKTLLQAIIFLATHRADCKSLENQRHVRMRLPVFRAAWKDLEDMATDVAKQEYIKAAESLSPGWQATAAAASGKAGQGGPGGPVFSSLAGCMEESEAGPVRLTSHSQNHH